ncbi:DUF4160 domain-containing protein [Rhodoplanes sp. SY1]|uniref:DUF4160 domain-containing protein n=1 Tax=Rhodoplanes sp. SY1 TaxID=3166646 RepID=UPI0038B6AC26
MPTVAIVDGVKIQFYWDDHSPAHFHVEHGEYRAQIAIDSLSIINGYIPKAQYRKVVTWAKPRKSELLKAWIQCQSDLHPGSIG